MCQEEGQGGQGPFVVMGVLTQGANCGLHSAGAGVKVNKFVDVRTHLEWIVKVMAIY